MPVTTSSSSGAGKVNHDSLSSTTPMTLTVSDTSWPNTEPSRGGGGKRPWTLPLLEGWWKDSSSRSSEDNSSSSSAVRTLVLQTIQQWRAAQKIARWCERRYLQGTTSSDRRSSSSPRYTRKQDRLISTFSSSWLLRLLQSPSVEERTLALEVFAKGLYLRQDEAEVWTWFEIVGHWLQRELGRTTGGAGSGNRIPLWIALLQKIWHHPGGSCENAQVWAVAALSHPKYGMVWLCRSLWEQAKLYFQTGSSLQQQQQQNAPVRTILLCLVEATQDGLRLMPEDWLWRTTTPSSSQTASPLSQILATYYLWKATGKSLWTRSEYQLWQGLKIWLHPYATANHKKTTSNSSHNKAATTPASSSTRPQCLLDILTVSDQEGGHGTSSLTTTARSPRLRSRSLNTGATATRNSAALSSRTQSQVQRWLSSVGQSSPAPSPPRRSARRIRRPARRYENVQDMIWEDEDQLVPPPPGAQHLELDHDDEEDEEVDLEQMEEDDDEEEDDDAMEHPSSRAQCEAGEEEDDDEDDDHANGDMEEAKLQQGEGEEDGDRDRGQGQQDLDDEENDHRRAPPPRRPSDSGHQADVRGQGLQDEDEDEDEEIDSDEGEDCIIFEPIREEFGNPGRGHGNEEDRVGDDDDDDDVEEEEDDEEEEDPHVDDDAMILQEEDDDEDAEDSHDPSRYHHRLHLRPHSEDDYDNNDIDEEEDEEQFVSSRGDGDGNVNGNPGTNENSPNMEHLLERKRIYLQACMQVLQWQTTDSSNTTQDASTSLIALAHRSSGGWNLRAERDLLASVLHIVRPPKRPYDCKMILRRAPTQEDFFRGNLSKNPLHLNHLSKDGEATVKQLRQTIADDLQMGDSAELLELLVANKILDVDLKLRVVHQKVWKDYLIRNSSGGGDRLGSASSLSSLLGGRGGASGITARSLLASTRGGGLSMIFSSSLGVAGGSSGDLAGTGASGITEDTPLSALPPMVVTYRLTGVDGEATEDTVTTLEDPQAPSMTTDPVQLERQLEKEFGMTRYITQERGIHGLLKSAERSISETLRKIRRDEAGSGDNAARAHFKTSPPFPGLVLISCCAKLPSNRKLLLEARAPTILLRLLLDALHALEDQGQSERNPTAKELQELIEGLASEMLSSDGATLVTASASAKGSEQEQQDLEVEDASTLRLLLSAIETSSLSRPLRNVIAKLLPYLTYGQAALSKELANEFVRHVDLDRLGEYEKEEEDYSQVLMATFVHASISLPDNDVCNSLRNELIERGYVQRIASFILQDFPTDAPSWSASLWAKGNQPSAKRKTQLDKQWRTYLSRSGLKPAFDMLIGLSRNHATTQEFVGSFALKKHVPLIQACHWIEATSDNAAAKVCLRGLGLVAETLLDELASEKSPVSPGIKAIRAKTRDRKNEIAMERRNRALQGMLGAKKRPAEGSSTSLAKSPMGEETAAKRSAASFLAPVLGLLGNSDAAGTASSQPPPTKRRKTGKDKESENEAPPTKPAWMADLEEMEDETGLTCAVCQEGRTLQPSELLGLYAYVKKVAVPFGQCGGRNHIDGTTLLTSLPPSMPASLSDSHAAQEWFPQARATGDELKESNRTNALSSVTSSRRATYFTTTVSAGNAIHFSCHNRARQADRNHPKAPKSEWEGATLRNNRVNCNVIMPLVTSRSSKVPLVAVDLALTEHQTAVSNLLGARPKSMLWNVLHDVRFLLLRIAYGEPLNADCGGGSLASNSQLVFHQLLTADMFEKDSQVDAPETAKHARNLSSGFLAASAMIRAEDYNKRNQSIVHRGIADSSVMACLTCILFHNSKDDYSAKAASTASSNSDEVETPHSKRQWLIGREYFLRGLLNCAGRRHALGVDDSGCTASHNSGKRRRPGSFSDWDIVDEDEMIELGRLSSTASRTSASSTLMRSSSANIDDFRDAIRPMVVFFAMMDQLSKDFVVNLDDGKIEECSNHLVDVVNACDKCKSINDLLRQAKVDLGNDEIMEELQRGMMAA